MEGEEGLVRPSEEGREGDDAGDVEGEQQLAVELVGPADERPCRSDQRLRGRLEVVVLGVHHRADGVHEQADRPGLGPHHDVHRVLDPAARPRREPLPHVDGRNDLATQVDEAPDRGRGQRHRRHRLGAQDLLDALHLDAEQLAVDDKGGELLAAHAGAPA